MNGTLCWGIELMILGDRKQGHLDRFGPQGKYAPLKCKEWRVVDFRMHKKQGTIERADNYIYVEVDDDARELTMFFPGEDTGHQIRCA